jgi:uncharacterized protein (TIGR03790 family)
VILRIIAWFAAAVGLATCCWGALQPEEIVIVAARGSRESEGLARYYARVRGVPTKNLCLVDLPGSELLPREAWEAGVRPEIRKWLIDRDPEQKIRCLLTVWGVPLKIGPAEADVQSREYQRFLTAERAHRLKLLDVLQGSLDQITPDAAVSGNSGADALNALDGNGAAGATQTPAGDDAPVTNEKSAPDADDQQGTGAGPEVKPESDLVRARTRLEKSLQGAQARISKLAAGDTRRRAQLQLQQLAAAAGGSNVILQGLNQQITANPDIAPTARSEFDALRGRAAAFLEVRFLMEQMPPSIERDAMVLAILERIGGLLASVEWLDEQLKVVTQNESGASFDSELALVMWPDDYQLLRWQPNYLRPSYENSQLPKIYRTFMVARLDAPTLMLAKNLVDTAIKVEAEGLRGKVYLDGRGIAKLEDANHLPGSYGDYDRALLVTAKGIDEQTELEVKLDTSPELFQAGACPDAALYCGWYSLAKYVDAFDWKPGAVAYHLASSEAHTLRDPASHAWCKKLIEDGVCATIGPVYEPYLGSFPRPNEFFALLLRGDLTLVECYARTSPYNSWMMTLIGDPLYRPFKYRVGAIAGPAVPMNAQSPAVQSESGN